MLIADLKHSRPSKRPLDTSRGLCQHSEFSNPVSSSRRTLRGCGCEAHRRFPSPTKVLDRRLSSAARSQAGAVLYPCDAPAGSHPSRGGPGDARGVRRRRHYRGGATDNGKWSNPPRMSAHGSPGRWPYVPRAECRGLVVAPQRHRVSRETSLSAARNHWSRSCGCYIARPAARTGYRVVHTHGFIHRTAGLAGSRPRKHGRLCSLRA